MADSYTTLARIVGTLGANRGQRDIEQMLYSLGSLLETLDAEMIKHFDLRKVVIKFASHLKYGNKARQLVVRFNEIINREKIDEKWDRNRLPPYLRSTTPTESLRSFKIPKKNNLSLSQPTAAPPSPKFKSILKKRSKYSTVPRDFYPSCENEEEYTVVSIQKTESTYNLNNVYVPVTYIPAPRRVPVEKSYNAQVVVKRKIPKLFTLCEQLLLEDPFKPTNVHVSFSRLSHLLETSSAVLLHTVEINMPWLESGIESLWRKRLARDFSSARLYPMETYGDAYRRCHVEKEINDEAAMHTQMVRLFKEEPLRSFQAKNTWSIRE